MLSGLAHIDTRDRQRFRGQVALMDLIPDTTQPDHTQVQDHLSARNRPRHARAFESLRKDDLACGFDVSTIKQ